MSQHDEIERLKQAIAAQEALRGILPDEQIEAALQALRAQLARYQAEVQGSGAVAQGEGATAVGQGGVGIGGDANRALINTGEGSQIQQVQAPVKGDVLGPGAQKTVVLHYGPEGKGTSPSSQELENAYLAWLLEQTNLLPLEGIDPAAASRAEEQVRLHAVYTALLTLSAEAHERLERGEAHPREVRRRSALEELNARRRLVLLGDPGSGKSTFVNFVALCLVGERLGRADINLQTLTAPLPDDDGDDRKERQPWEHGALLPVRIVLRDFAARGLPETGEPTAEHLWAFLSAELHPAILREVVPHLRRVFTEQGGLFLFDGLDEVPEAEQRRERIVRFIHQVALAYPKARVLVTSRTYAYRHQDWALEDFAVAVLAPFSRGQIIRFVHRWYDHTAQLRRRNAEDARGRARALVRAILRNERLYELAERPLLLTLMASLHAWRGGALPEKREQLYAEAVDLLLDRWERQRVVRDRHGKEIIQPSLSEYLAVGKDDLRAFLNRLAYEAHARQPELRGTADIPEKALLEGLLELAVTKDVRPQRLVAYLRDRAGLLVPRGVGMYTFPHRTFQEYLAACHLTDRAIEVGGERLEFPENVAALARRDPDRWREVALLAGAKASRGSVSNAWGLAEALCLHPVPQGAELPAEEVWGAFLAGQVLVENVDLSRVSERNRPKRDRVREWLAVILASNALPAVERAAAGKALTALGDPRAGVLEVDEMPFAFVPAGPFLMGSPEGEGREAEQPQHEVTLPAYWMACYPVTNAQFAAFVEDGGYARADLWPEAHAAGVWQDGQVKAWNEDEPRDRPYDFGEPFNLPNHPVVGITWYEALAFVRWLTHRWRAQGWLPLGWQVALPSEAEWEKAAHGGLEIPREAFLTSPADLTARPDLPLEPNPLPGRRYPWGDEFDLDRANTNETGLGTTSAVGAFPRGASPYGVLDLSGNVWEWTRSVFQSYLYDLVDEREDLNAPPNVRRALRGGSFNRSQIVARTAVRDKGYPVIRSWNLGFRVVVVPVSVASER